MCLRNNEEAGVAGQEELEPSWWEMGPKGVCRASWPMESTWLLRLSTGEAAEGLGRGLTCFDIHLRGIV